MGVCRAVCMGVCMGVCMTPQMPQTPQTLQMPQMRATMQTPMQTVQEWCLGYVCGLWGCLRGANEPL